MPFEIKVMIFKFLDSKSQINFINTCQENTNLIDFCKIDFRIFSFEGMETSPYFESFTFINVVTKLIKLPKNTKILIFGIKYTNSELSIINDLLNLEQLLLKSDDNIDLIKYVLPALKILNIAYCPNCQLNNSIIKRLKYIIMHHTCHEIIPHNEFYFEYIEFLSIIMFTRKSKTPI